jgi:hypothetical protein
MRDRLLHWIRLLHPFLDSTAMGRLARGASRGILHRHSGRNARLQLEGLEDRTLLASSVAFSLPSHLVGTPSGILAVPVSVSHLFDAGGDSGLHSAEVVLTYNPSLFSVAPADVSPGSLLTSTPASGVWTMQAVVPGPGEIDITATSSTPDADITSQAGGVFANVAFHVVANAAAGYTSIHVIVPQQTAPSGASSFAIDQVNQSPYVLNPADQVDGVARINIPSTMTVTTTSGSAQVAGSLPWTVALVNADTTGRTITINFASALAGRTIALSSTLDLRNITGDAIVITAPAAGLTLAGGGHASDFSVIKVEPSTTVTLNGLTIANGHTTLATEPGAGIFNYGDLTINQATIRNNAVAGPSNGGGIFNSLNATLAVNNTTLFGNTCSANGGGICNLGTATITNAVIKNNTVYAQGGGIANSGTLTVTGTTFSGNYGAQLGGGLYNNGNATISNSTLSGNTAYYGGGVDNDRGGSMTLTNVTLASNTAGNGGAGGGIFNTQTAVLTVTSATIAYNSVSGLGNGGGGIDNAGSLTLLNSIVAYNTAPANLDLNGNGETITSGYDLIGYVFGLDGTGIRDQVNGNLVGHDPLLAPLANYGGPTQTFALLPGSFACGAGMVASTSGTDERGVPRPVGAPSDIGAFQSRGFTVSIVPGDSPQATATGASFVRPLTVVVTANDPGVPVNGGMIRFTVESGAAGQGASLSHGTVVISGGQATVTAIANATPGAYTVVATADADPAAFDLTNAAAPQGPAFTSDTVASFIAGTNGTFTVAASGVPTPSLSESKSDRLPAGVTFRAADGVLSGMPAPTSAGVYVLHFTAHNGVGPDARQTLTLLVQRPAAFASPAAATFKVGSTNTFAVKTVGVPKPTLSEASGEILPAGFSFDAVTGVLTGNPSPGTGGTYLLHFTATNGVGDPATQTFTLTIDQPPAFTNANNATFTAGSAGTFSFAATGFPAPTLSERSSDRLPAGVQFTPSTGVLTGTPTVGGIYTLHFTARNGVGRNATQTFTLHVNQAPMFTSADAATFAVGRPARLALKAVGFPAPAFSESPDDTLPAGITFNPATGVLSGTPAPGTDGIYTLQFTAHNGIGDDATQTFVLIVGVPPAFTSAARITFTIGADNQFTVAASGFPAPTLTEAPGDRLPSGVTFDPATGLLSGTPASGSAGTYKLHFTARNATRTVSQLFTLQIH